ncbi:ribosome biogenesis GTP-binding protein YsxC [Bacteroides sp. 1_1_14]|nr:ribosome biogenesis GTP-binding protein YsxC [Bacteroides sp. 1_1_14]
MSDRSISRIRLHRAVECRKVEPYQYADCPQRTGDDLRHTGKDNAYQPLPDQPKLVPGRSSRIRLRQTRTKGKDQIRTIIEDYILEREQMTNLFVLIDSRLEPQKIDLEFMEWLGENGIPFSIIFTKADKLKGGRLKMNINNYLRELSKEWEELPPYFVSSSENRTGRTEILDYIENISKEVYKNK